MPLHPQLRELLDRVNAIEGPPVETQPVEVQRSGLQALAGLALPVEGVDTQERMVMGGAGELYARVYRPAGVPSGERLPGLVYFHGGGFVVGDLDTHDPFCRALALVAQATVVSVDYRLAPEYPFPAAVEDAVTATASVAQLARELGVDDARLAVGGDSAGANVALLAAVAARDEGTPALSGVFLLYPWADLAMDRPSYDTYGEGYILRTPQLLVWRELYAGAGADWSDPRLSPLRAELAGLPRTLVVTAEFDPLHDEGVELAGRLADAGVEVEHVPLEGTIHTFVHLGGVAPVAAATVDRVAEHVRQLLAG